MWSTIASSILRFALGIAFLASAWPKLREPEVFLSYVYQYQLVGAETGLFIATVLPCVEITLAGCFFMNLLARGAFLATATVCVAFAFAQAHAIHNELAIACGCFSLDPSDIVSLATVVRPLMLLGLALSGLVLSYRLRPV